MITDTEARRIAGQWHGGGGTALYAFASTGAIDTARDNHDLSQEITECIAYIDDPSTKFDEAWTQNVAKQDRDELIRLLTYAQTYGPRGPQPGWHNLTW